MADIYGKYRASMERVMDGLVRQIEANGTSDTGEKRYEHLRRFHADAPADHPGAVTEAVSYESAVCGGRT